jgi:hypothetical protein
LNYKCDWDWWERECECVLNEMELNTQKWNESRLRRPLPWTCEDGFSKGQWNHTNNNTLYVSLFPPLAINLFIFLFITPTILLHFPLFITLLFTHGIFFIFFFKVDRWNDKVIMLS